MVEWQRQHKEVFGADNLDYDYFAFIDKLGILTANATTPYVIGFPNVAESGPLVMEFPAGAIAGGIMDFWQRPLAYLLYLIGLMLVVTLGGWALGTTIWSLVGGGSLFRFVLECAVWLLVVAVLSAPLVSARLRENLDYTIPR